MPIAPNCCDGARAKPDAHARCSVDPTSLRATSGRADCEGQCKPEVLRAPRAADERDKPHGIRVA
eukprot:453810-Amphidinium_carterae.1